MKSVFFSARVLILIDLSCKIKEELVDGTMVRFLFTEKNKEFSRTFGSYFTGCSTEYLFKVHDNDTRTTPMKGFFVFFVVTFERVFVYSDKDVL